jgi:hypothetical protein
MNRFTYNECTEQLHEDDKGELCLYEDVEKLEAERDRYREALEKILEVRGHAGDDWDIKEIAEQALKQVGEE